eukprot:TRINITY_DN18062_c0_g1_i1.p1 TRINITY_DN18062_c0_g1~~TRINITY_DN18062_c0_g1_i1.p1  ORF type:complete len:588 (+),score=155.20 TRINITY_DN18062_c0_g1_i1:205-1764(+)
MRPLAPWDYVTLGAPVLAGRHPEWPIPTGRPIGEDIATLGVAVHYDGVLSLAQVRAGVERLLRSHESLRLCVQLGSTAAPAGPLELPGENPLGAPQEESKLVTAPSPPVWAGWAPAPGLETEDGAFAQWAEKLVVYEPRRSADQWQERITSEVNKGLPNFSSAPMWRVICLQDEAARSGDIIIVYGHNVGDGVAAHTLAHGLLAHATGQPAEQWPGRAKIDVGDCLGPAKLWERMLTYLLVPFLRREMTAHATAMPPCGQAARAVEGRPMLPLWRDGTPGKLPEALACAKREGVRFFALCVAANLFALAPAIFSDPSRKAVKSKFMFPAGMRGRCTRTGVSKDDIANVSLLPEMTLKYDRSTRFWDLARAVQKSCVNATDPTELRVGGQVFTEMLTYDTGIVGEIVGSNNTEGDVMLSNLGAHPWPTQFDCGVQLRSLHFHQHMPITSTRAYFIWPMSVGKTATYSLVYAPHHTSKQQADAFFDAFLGLVDDPTAIGDMTVTDYVQRNGTPLLSRAQKE